MRDSISEYDLITSSDNISVRRNDVVVVCSTTVLDSILSKHVKSSSSSAESNFESSSSKASLLAILRCPYFISAWKKAFHTLNFYKLN